VKLSPRGGVIWARDAFPSDRGVSRWANMGRWFDTTPDGGLAFQGLRVWSSDGVERWSRRTPLHTREAVTVDRDGVVYIGYESPINFESTLIRRHAADGTELTDFGSCSQYWFAMDATSDALWTTCSGHSHVDLHRRAFAGGGMQVERASGSGDYVHNGVAADGVGHAVWVYARYYDLTPHTGFVAVRVDSAGAVDWEITRRGIDISATMGGSAGMWAEDVAADADGDYALAGGLGTTSISDGWIQVLRP